MYLPHDLMDEKVRMAELPYEIQRLLPSHCDIVGSSLREIHLIDAMGLLGLIQGSSELHEACLDYERR